MRTAARENPNRIAPAVQRDVVRDVQRSRIISAMAELVCEPGQEGVSVRQIVTLAGVSRRRFYELFDNCDDCFRATFEEAVARACQRASVGYRSKETWTERLRAALGELLAFLDAEPELARMSILYATPGSPASVRRGEVLERLAAAVDEGGRTERGCMHPPPLTAEAVVAGALGVVQTRLLEPDHGPLTALVNPLLSVIVLPYLGRAVALRELGQPVNDSATGKPAPKGRDPLSGLDMRLTYRTLRVLAEVAASPGISNRAVAEAAEVRDAGQISKLLSRVEALGLVRNTGAGHAKGAANAWVITMRGAEVDRAVGPRLVRRSWQGGGRGV